MPIPLVTGHSVLFFGPRSDGSFNPAFDDSPLYIPYFEASGRIGNANNIVQGDVFLPLWQTDRELLLLDARYHWAEPRAHEGNLGIGYRQIKNQWISGAYAYYDRIETQQDNTFNQLTLGVEMMSIDWDLRLNGYIPEVGSKLGSNGTTAAITGGTVVVNNAIERAYHGFDAEVSRLLMDSDDGQSELRGFLTGYYFDHKDFDHKADGYSEIAGVRTRLEYRLFDLAVLGQGSRLMLGAQHQYDDVRKNVTSALVSLRIPLGRSRGRTPSRLQRRMMNPVVRDVNVVTNTAGFSEQAVFADSGQAINNVVIIDESTTDIAATIASASDDATIMTNGTLETASPLVLKSGQSLDGGGFAVKGSSSGNYAWLASPSGTLVGLDANQDVITLGDNSTVRSLSIAGGRNSIAGDSVMGVVIDDVTVSGAANRGIELAGYNDTVISNSRIGQGVGLGDFGGSVSENTITANADSAVFADDFHGTIVNNNNVDGESISALGFQTVSGGMISNNTVSTNTSWSAINVANMFGAEQGTAISVSSIGAGVIDSNTFTTAGVGPTDGGNGIHVGIFNGGTISNNVVAGIQKTGLAVSQMNGGTVTGNSFSDAVKRGC